MRRMAGIMAYRRTDGRVGIRNYVLVISMVSCSNSVAERIARARSFPGELARVVLSPESAYGRVLRAEAEALKDEEDAYVFHEFLEDENRPTYVHEFLARAARL